MNLTQPDMDMIEVLVEDHREIDSIFCELEVGVAAQDRSWRRQLVSVVIAELVRHFAAEEQHLYPTARGVLNDGAPRVDAGIADHTAAEQTMKRLEAAEPTEPLFERLLAGLIQDIRSHIGREETELFPRLRNACTAAELIALGDSLAEAKRTAPTRPHPTAPDTPPVNRLLDPGAGLVDRVRDAVTNRPTGPQELREPAPRSDASDRRDENT